MKAVLCDGAGGPEVLRIGDVERPTPAPDQVLVKVAATSVNRADVTQRQGNYPPPPGESEILGLEVAGTIDALGANVSGWQVGDRVMSLVGGGGYAEYAVAYGDHLIAIPESMSFEQAACVCETYITAFLNVFMIGGLTAAPQPAGGDTSSGDGSHAAGDASALLHGGGGGVNTAAIHLCRALAPAAQLIVTASTGKLDRVRGLGVDLVIDYTQQDFAEEVRAYTDGRGVDLILDHIGAEYLTRNMKALAVGGTLMVIGVMGGRKAELDLARMMVKRQRIIGSVLRARPVPEKAAIVRAFTETVVPFLADGTIEPLVDVALPLEEVRRGHETMEAGGHFGKIVLQNVD